ncbi:putative nuclease of restriction endonuclease-like (RecB) superfamily [Microbacterium sp. AK009]|uniref:DUF1016 N-terminal domain-containing protein n=1 Tax=Microbacterium sp. AK009 TaxID=2723068 RepID=UPI0015C9B67B|nr:DUF1016 N-terminal domain-containing protein [Microbacterium sp. AK009]NYF17995.1 putative nuclease of restriction endonuclease-like (RecB) superfamily [Microbacterium sp. AK009]
MSEDAPALIDRVRSARHTLQRRANAEVIALYWQVGAAILERKEQGTDEDAALKTLATGLRDAYPTMTSFTVEDLRRMRDFAASWPARGGIVQQPIGQLPWGHVVELLARLSDQGLREWYAGKAVQHTWNRAELVHHIAARRHEHDTEAPQNFAAALRRADSALAEQLNADPDTIGFLAVGIDRAGIP